MAAAGAFNGAQSKRKPTMQVDRNPRDGLTGMSFSTQKHFVEVQQKMIDYVNEQEVQYDEKRPNPQPQLHHRHPHTNPGFLDGKKAQKSRSAQSSTSVASHKQLAHLGLATPQSEHRHRRSSPRPSAK
jgi:hypothetical protein